MIIILSLIWIFSVFSHGDPGMIGHLGFLAIFIFWTLQEVINSATEKLEKKLDETIKAVKAQGN